jgi:hypothetical protein
MISTKRVRRRLEERVAALRFTLRAAFKRLAKLTIYRNKIIILASRKDFGVIPEIKRRSRFYLGTSKIPKFIVAQTLPPVAEDIHILQCSDDRDFSPKIHRIAKKKYRVNHTLHIAAGDWWKFASSYLGHKVDIDSSYELFRNYIKRLQSLELTKCYVFGTGPSLAGAIKREWDDGYRVVCNTIVRDPVLFSHINPHFIIAGDPIYHFSDTAYARSFRSDLCQRLLDSESYFAYPEFYDLLFRRDFATVQDRLIPIPIGSHEDIHTSLLNRFSLPSGGNALPKMLLPIGCSLAKQIELWGFDGRSPSDGDVPFWANSVQHNYADLMPGLKQEFPFFFNDHVPDNDSTAYIQAVHGDRLERRLTAAERVGFSFKMLHHSWTPTLAKRISTYEKVKVDLYFNAKDQ